MVTVLYKLNKLKIKVTPLSLKGNSPMGIMYGLILNVHTFLTLSVHTPLTLSSHHPFVTHPHTGTRQASPGQGYLPMQTGWTPLQVPSARQRLREEPTRRKGALHWKETSAL